MAKKVISFRSSAADRFALVASTVVGFDSIAKVEPVVGRIKVRQVYDPWGRFTFEDLSFKTIDRARVYIRPYGDETEWGALPKFFDGLEMELDHVELIHGLLGCPGIVGNGRGFNQIVGWIGIRVWDLVGLVSRPNIGIPKVLDPTVSCEEKLAFLNLIAEEKNLQLRGLQVNLNFDRNTSPGFIHYIHPDKTDEYRETHDSELLSVSRYTWGVTGEIISVVIEGKSRKLIVRGSCEGGPGNDVVLDMVVPDTYFISGLTKPKNQKD